MIGNIKIMLNDAKLSQEGEKRFKNPRKRDGYISYTYEITSAHSEKGIGALKVILCKYKNENIIKLENNLSEWFLGRDLDLSCNQYIECLELIENKIGLEKDSIWKAKVTQISIGVITKCKREDFIKFLSLITGHKELRNIERSEAEIKFIGVNYEFKLVEIADSNKGEILSFGCYVEIKKISGVKKVYDLLSVLGHIKNKWDDVIDLQKTFLDNITFDILSERKIMRKEKELNNLLKTKLKKDYNKTLIARKDKRVMNEILTHIKMVLNDKKSSHGR